MPLDQEFLPRQETRREAVLRELTDKLTDNRISESPDPPKKLREILARHVDAM
jgi:hypothetical protein